MELVGLTLFAGMYSLAETRNDLNPEANAQFHLEALEFVSLLAGKYKGCIFDPPYSISQVSISYKEFGIEGWSKDNRTGGFSKVRDRISELIEQNGTVISFGWNTVGMGKNRGFEIEEILIVSHGGNRNDTLITVERKSKIYEQN